MPTKEEKFWSSKFGAGYLERNRFSNKELDNLYRSYFGIPRSRLNKEFLQKLKIKNVLEVGCNIGNQLAMLQSQGFKNLYGVDIFPEAVEEAKTHTKGINIIQGSAFELPFKDNYFDLVFTSTLLIHIHPKDIKKVMREIYRVSKKYIWDYVYYNPTYIPLDYRNIKEKMWKGNFAKMYLSLFPDLKIVKIKNLPYKNTPNQDQMYLLRKK